MKKETTHALLIRKSNISPLCWLVQYKDKELYFESLAEAISFCKVIIKEDKENEN